MMKFIKLYGDFSGTVDELADEEAGRLMKAVLRFALDGQVADLPGQERLVFKMLVAQFQRDRAAYDEMVAMGRFYGKRGGRPKKVDAEKGDPFPENPPSPHHEDKDKDQDKDKDKEAVKRFAPPSPQDVREYCALKGLAVDPDGFCDFYAAKGWRVGQQSMKDWRAAVRSWARRDALKGGVNLAGHGLSGPPQPPPQGRYQLPDQLL